MQSPSGTPFADIIQSLAGLHQEQHQHMLAIKEEQDKRFEVLLRAQHEDREMFRSWVDREVRAIPSSKDSTSPLPLNKMGPQDDPEAFLDLFEKSAEARGWPPGDWPMRLIPLLSGEAQVAAHQLPVQNLLVYRDLKRAILQRVGRTPEQHRQRFRTLTLEESGRPFVMAQQLRDSCRKWLMADSSDVEDVIDRVVLEQFVAKLPRKTAQWVQCHRPTSLNQAIQLAEDQMVACPGVGDPLPSATLSLPPLPSLSPNLYLFLGPVEGFRRSQHPGGGRVMRPIQQRHPGLLPGEGVRPRDPSHHRCPLRSLPANCLTHFLPPGRR